MSGAIHLLPLYAFMAWTGSTLPCTLLFKMTCVSSGMPHSFDSTAVCVGDRTSTKRSHS